MTAEVAPGCPVDAAFDPLVNDLIPTIRRVAGELLDGVTAAGPGFDLVGELAFPLPASIVFSLIGVPEADVPQLKR